MKKAVSRPADRITAQTMMAAIIAPVQFDCLKTKPEGTPKQIVSTVQHIPNTRFGTTVVNEKCPVKAAMIQSKKVNTERLTNSIQLNR